MKGKDWKGIAELVGIAAIVASLIFVGLQMKQSQEIALAAAYQSRADSSLALKGLVLESETLMTALTKVLHQDAPNLKNEENIALETYVTAQLVYLENIHYQYVNEFLSEEQWQANLGDLRSLLSVGFARDFWVDHREIWRQSFASEVDEVLAELQESGGADPK